MKLPRIKIFSHLHLSWNVLWYVALAMTLSLFVWTGLYLYQNVYKSFLYTETSVQLKALVAPETFNLNEVKMLLEKINQKQNQSKIDWLHEPNIFLKTRVSSIAPKPSPVTSPSTPEAVNQAILP